MTKLSSLEKRVKRRITARTHRFFAACPPGLKNLCYREIAALTEKLKFIKSTTTDDLTGEIEPALFQDIEIIVGGVEFTSAVQGCYAANLYLRSPSKILMRIAHFKAENFRTLEKKLKEIEWELYLNPDLTFQVEVSAKSSRLYHTDAVANRGEKVIKDYFSKLSNSFGNLKNPHDRKQSSNKKEGEMVSQTIMIRAEDDKFEISIDSSGELLHKRGLKENVGAAPIRETLAFAILSAMNYPFGCDKSKSFNSDYPFSCNKSKSFNVDRKSDFDLTGLTEPPYLTKQLPLIDGMCGSGTFALEAAMIADNIPAGFFRHFAFEAWPCFRAGQWNYIKKMAEADMPQSYKTAEPQEPFIFALDKNDKILKELERTVEIFNFGSSIKIMQGDFFDIVPERLISEQNGLDQESTAISEKSLPSDIKGFVVLNPPYGKRIGDKWESEKMFAKIGKKLESDFKGWRAGVVLPDRKFLHYLPGRKSLIPLFHGGLEIYAAIIQI
ncbi:MAG: class I SAM-dependent RNA methyltransferase [Desulfamplus sp.]